MPGVLPIISTLDDIAQAIDDPPLNRPFERAIGLQGQKVCDAISNAPAWTTSGVGFMPAASLMCGPYWAREGISPPVFEPALVDGGQCAGVSYTILFTNENGAVFNVGSRAGPISVVKGENYRDDNRELIITGAGGSGPIAVYNGTVTTQREDGLPDDCGSPPDSVTPGPNPSPRNPTIPPEEQPYSDPITGPTLPIPPLPTIPGLPDIELPTNPFGRGTEPLPPGLPGTPGTPEPTGDNPGSGAGAGGGEAEGEAPPGSELIGLKLNLISALPNSGDYGDGVYRAGAYIRMGTPVGLDQDFGGSHVEDGQFFFAEREGLTKWRVTANIGLNWLVTPYYREV